MTDRRQFLTQFAAGSAISLTGYVPATFAQIARQATKHNTRQVLVVIFLQGGNDGLNTVVPADDPLYKRHRRRCRIAAANAISLDDELYFHPALRNLAGTWEDNRLAIVQGVGYPNHNQSHFVSTAVWHSGDIEAQPQYGDGWLGKSLDPLQLQTDAPMAWSLGTHDTPHMLRGRHTRTAMPPRLTRFEAEEVLGLLRRKTLKRNSSDASLVQARSADAASAMEKLLAAQPRGVREFPNTRLGGQLAKVAWLIESDTPAPVYFLNQPGYDTHAGQAALHGALLGELGDALAAFDRRMYQTANSNRVTTLVFSEFGRRVAENDSGGTDHGKAGPVFLVGGSVRPGLHGGAPDIEHTDNGNVAVTCDFRGVYKSVLRQLEIEDGALADSIEPLDLFRAGA